jgi:hypothetical protein
MTGDFDIFRLSVFIGAPHNARSITEIENTNFQELAFINGVMFFIAGYTFADIREYFPPEQSPAIITRRSPP